jgi:SAM-dependent methyltransferase
MISPAAVLASSHSANGSGCPELVCPACRLELKASERLLVCEACGRAFPLLHGIPDVRLRSDRYLSMAEDRAKARRLESVARTRDLEALVLRYYELTSDVDPIRRRLYQAHLAHAPRRGAALAELLPKRGLILEVGCGSGGLLQAAAGQGRRIVGIDIALRWLMVARKRLTAAGCSAPIVAASALELPWSDNTFDAVVADSVLEHLDGPGAAFCEWARVLKPGGSLIVWSPNRRSLSTDPHVGLWGLGWMPRTWASAYVKRRRGCAWTVRPLAPSDARRLCSPDLWRAVQVSLPRVRPEALLDVVGPLRVQLYERARRFPLLNRFLLSVGPLWELHAIKREDG